MNATDGLHGSLTLFFNASLSGRVPLSHGLVKILNEFGSECLEFRLKIDAKNTLNWMSSIQSILSMICAKKSGSHAGSGSSRSCSCDGACLSSSLCWVLGLGMKIESGGHLQVVGCKVYKTFGDIGLKAMTAK